MSRSHRFWSYLAAASVLFAPLAAAPVVEADAPTDAAPAVRDAEQFLKDKHAEAERLLRRPPSADRDRRLGTLLGELVDYEELAKRALDRHWEARSPAERERFVTLLRQLVERSYRDNLRRTLDYVIEYDEATAEGDELVVETRARSRANRRAPAVTIEYFLHRKDGALRVHDVRTDGSSLVRNYRNQFRRIIERDGFDALLSRMQSRLGADEASPL